MAVLAAMTLIIGVYPNPFLNPIIAYIQGIFSHNSQVLQVPTQGHGGIHLNKNLLRSDNMAANNMLSDNNNVPLIQVLNSTKGEIRE
jgi:hypothetical protein